jgi:hypothetical protein
MPYALAQIAPSIWRGFHDVCLEKYADAATITKVRLFESCDPLRFSASPVRKRRKPAMI